MGWKAVLQSSTLLLLAACKVMQDTQCSDLPSPTQNAFASEVYSPAIGLPPTWTPSPTPKPTQTPIPTRTITHAPTRSPTRDATPATQVGPDSEARLSSLNLRLSDLPPGYQEIEVDEDTPAAYLPDIQAADFVALSLFSNDSTGIMVMSMIYDLLTADAVEEFDHSLKESPEKKADELTTLSGLGLAFKIETLKDFTPVGDICLAMRTTVEAGGETIHDDMLTFRRGSITTTVLIMNVRPGSEPPSLQTLANIVETLQAE